MTIRSSSAGTGRPLRWLGGTGVAWMCWISILSGLSASKTSSPVSSQYATQPSAYRSARRSTGSPLAISGAM